MHLHRCAISRPLLAHCQQSILSTLRVHRFSARFTAAAASSSPFSRSSFTIPYNSSSIASSLLSSSHFTSLLHTSAYRYAPAETPQKDSNSSMQHQSSAQPTTASSSSSSSRPPPPPPPPPSFSRSTSSSTLSSRNTNYLYYLFGIAVLMVGASFAAIPLYRAFCAHTGYGGTTQEDRSGEKLSTMKPSKKEVMVMFNADVSPSMHWKFIPSQHQLKVRLGEPVLAFYKATNNLNYPVTGVATYNVTPTKAGLYFHKIQCFCFDEQRLRAKETVDMPVFFYIDPKMETDHRTLDVTHLTLSYTFFPVESEEEEENSVVASALSTNSDQPDVSVSGLRFHTTGAPLPEGFTMPEIFTKGQTKTATHEPIPTQTQQQQSQAQTQTQETKVRDAQTK